MATPTLAMILMMTSDVLETLAMLGLCDYPFSEQEPDENDVAYPIGDYAGTDLMNLLRMISARQLLLNRALDVRGAFLSIRN